jgi:hypothetical protein
LRGVVHDESGGALPGATVVATHTETGATRTATTRIRALLRQGAAEHHDERAASGDGPVHRGDGQNPTSLTDPLGGLTFEDYKNQNRPRNITVLGNDYATPRSDQVSIGMAQQIGARYAVQADFVHTKGMNEPRQREVNQFEDPDTHLPRNPAQFGRLFPQYLRITRYETSAKCSGSVCHTEPDAQ